jgi:hypothetical protein
MSSGHQVLRGAVGIIWMKRAGRRKEKAWQDHTINSFVAAFLRELLIGLKNMSPEENNLGFL